MALFYTLSGVTPKREFFSKIGKRYFSYFFTPELDAKNRKKAMVGNRKTFGYRRTDRQTDRQTFWSVYSTKVENCNVVTHLAQL